ncbi:hypothetical protein [Noviherbaspirillum pedocola]|uniref:Uncharacterized protein n=1 Tax=Noviherbaspirillum pedocola TaxID=2801341 RepID=A0A934T0E6_9BURK|nr:hypothetical protein [Noviherbaspirillum pedocola]MBK4736184.1 hypothetical protein [Noviherbaspirillum pedocola]
MRWLEPELQQIVSAIYCEHPDLFALETARGLKARHVFEAQDCLSKERRRPLISIAQNFDVTRIKLVELYRGLCSEGRIVGQPGQAATINDDSPVQGAQAMLSGPAHEHYPGAITETIKWNPNEWQSVATYLYRASPGFRVDGAIHAVTVDALAMAQESLAPSRRRSLDDLRANRRTDMTVLEAVFDVLRKSDPDYAGSVSRRQLRRVEPGNAGDERRSAVEQEFAQRYGAHYRLAPAQTGAPVTLPATAVEAPEAKTAAPQATIAQPAVEAFAQEPAATPVAAPDIKVEAASQVQLDASDAPATDAHLSAPARSVEAAPKATVRSEPAPALAHLAQTFAVVEDTDAAQPHPMRPFVRMVCEEMMRAAIPYLRPYLDQHLGATPHRNHDE